MTTRVITESDDAAALVQAVLTASGADMDVRVQSGVTRSSAISLARTYLGSTEDRVVLLLDAEILDSERLQEEQVVLEGLLGSMAPAERYRVILAQPELEAALFAHHEAPSWASHYAMTDMQLMRGAYQPRAVLHEVLVGRDGLAELIRELTPDDLGRLCRAQPFAQLLAEVESTR